MLKKYLLAILFISCLHEGLGGYAVHSRSSSTKWKLITRDEWGARPPTTTPETFKGPSSYLIIHHSYKPGAAYSKGDCVTAMHEIQNLHMDTNGWEDIGYSFAVCGDGNVYEGRGYDIVGAHAPHYNNRSIGLLLIGDYRAQLPTLKMLAVTKDFIKFSIKNGNLNESYTLYGHRQVRIGTECPGDALYSEIQKWPHWQEEVSDFTYLPTTTPTTEDANIIQ